jgi:hypothetical protein
MRLAIWRLETGGDLDRQLLYDAGRLALVGRDTELAERFAAAAVNRGWPVIGARVMIESALLRSSPGDVETAVASVWDRTDLTDGDVAHFAYRLADVRFVARRDLDGALAIIEEALTRITFPPSRALLEAHRAKMLANAARPLAAMEAIDRVTEVDDVRVRVDLATARSAALLTLGRCDEAIVAAREGAAAQADLPPWLARRGMAGHLVNEAHALAYSGRYRAPGPHRTGRGPSPALRSAGGMGLVRARARGDRSRHRTRPRSRTPIHHRGRSGRPSRPGRRRRMGPRRRGTGQAAHGRR